MGKSNTFRLTKPVLVWGLGFCYLAASPLHIFLMMFLGGDSEWYIPSHWAAMFMAFPLIDKAFCMFAPIAGASLLMQRKRSWALAIAGLMLAFAQNIWCIVSGVEMLSPIYLPLIGNSLVLVVLYYFRFPYLDRRDSVLRGYMKRFAIDVPVKCEGYDGVVAKSISKGGCGLEFSSNTKRPDVNSIVQLEINGFRLKGVVRYHHEEKIGIRFISPRRLAGKKVQQIIASSGSAQKAA